jgi:glycolate oxidase iron-sulfur subunit
MTQLKPGTTTPVVHTVELLDWATGGPRPPALANVAMRSTVDPAVTGDRSSA